jgi:hypothetical protein
MEVRVRDLRARELDRRGKARTRTHREKFQQ